VIVVLAIVSVLLLTNHDDPSYSCRGSAIVDVLNPEPDGSTSFRAVAFDAGHACNRDARVHVAIAGVALVVGLGAAALWFRRKRTTTWR
jgi:hypothetical protein